MQSCADVLVLLAGLGKEAARHYVRMGASRLILAVRDLDKGRVAKEEIVSSIDSAKTDIDVWHVDMGSYSSVQTFAARVNSELDRVDVFIANAGVANAKFSVLEEDESQITVNVVSTFLLAALVMPKLKATSIEYKSRPTLTITSSGAHAFAKFPQRSAPTGEIFTTISDKRTAERNWNGQYPLSKMLEIFTVRSIGEKYPASVFPVTVNCVDPGFCLSELSRDFPTLTFWIMKLLLARTTEIGSRALIHAASSGADTHGEYLSDCHVAQPAALVTGSEGPVLQDRLWVELTSKLEAIMPGVMDAFR